MSHRRTRDATDAEHFTRATFMVLHPTVMLSFRAIRSSAVARSEKGRAMDRAITVDCDGCRGREMDACGDCVVTFILGREPDDALIIDADEARAVRLLGEGGLVPPLRFEKRAASGD